MTDGKARKKKNVVFLLWEDEPYEPSSLYGVFATADGAERRKERERRGFRKQNRELGIGADGVYETVEAANAAADARMDSFRVQTIEVES